MALIQPPITGDPQLDSWTLRLTSQINSGILPGLGSTGGGGGGATGTGGGGNTTFYLYQRTTNATAPDRPNSVAFDFTDVENVTVTADNGWTREVPVDTAGDYLWVTFRYVADTSGTITNANSWDTPQLLSAPTIQNFVVTTREEFDAATAAANQFDTMYLPDALEAISETVTYSFDGVDTDVTYNVGELNDPIIDTLGVAPWRRQLNGEITNADFIFFTFIDSAGTRPTHNTVPEFAGGESFFAQDGAGTILEFPIDAAGGGRIQVRRNAVIDLEGTNVDVGTSPNLVASYVPVGGFIFSTADTLIGNAVAAGFYTFNGRNFIQTSGDATTNITNNIVDGWNPSTVSSDNFLFLQAPNAGSWPTGDSKTITTVFTNTLEADVTVTVTATIDIDGLITLTPGTISADVTTVFRTNGTSVVGVTHTHVSGAASSYDVYGLASGDQGDPGTSSRIDVAYASALNETFPGVNQVDNVAITGSLTGEVVAVNEVQQTTVTGSLAAAIPAVVEVQAFDVEGQLEDAIVGQSEQQDMTISGSLTGLVTGNSEVQTFTPTGTMSNVREIQGRTNEFLTLSLDNSFSSGAANVVDIQTIQGSGTAANTFTAANNEFFHFGLQSSFRSSTAGAVVADQALFSFDPDTTNTIFTGSIVNQPLGDNQAVDAALSTIANSVAALDSRMSWDGTYQDVASQDADFTFRLDDSAWHESGIAVGSGRSWGVTVTGPSDDRDTVRTYSSGSIIFPDTFTITPSAIRQRIFERFNACVGYTATYVSSDGLTSTTGPAGAWGIRVTGPAYNYSTGSNSDDGSGNFIQLGFGWNVRHSYRVGQTPDQSPFDFWGGNGQITNGEEVWTITDNATGQVHTRDFGARRVFRSGANRTQTFFGNTGFSGHEALRQVTVDTGVASNVIPIEATVEMNTSTAATLFFDETNGFAGEPASTYTVTGPGISSTILSASSGETLTSLNDRIEAVIEGSSDFSSVINGNNIVATSDAPGVFSAFNVAVNNNGGNGTVAYNTAFPRTQTGTANVPTSFVFDPQTTASPTLYTTITPSTDGGLNIDATAFLTLIGNTASALETDITWDGVVAVDGNNRLITLDLGTTTQVEATVTITPGNGTNTTLTSTRIDGSAGSLVGNNTVYTITDHNDTDIATINSVNETLAQVLARMVTAINDNTEANIDFRAVSNGTTLTLNAQSSGVVAAWEIDVDQGVATTAAAGDILFPAPAITMSGSADVPGVGTTIVLTDPEDSSTTSVVITGRDAGYSAIQIATLIAAATPENWTLTVTDATVRFETDSSRPVSGVWTGTSTSNTVTVPDATEVRSGITPVAIGTTSITVTTPDMNTATVAIDGAVAGVSAIEVSNALTTGLSSFTDWTVTSPVDSPTITFTADDAGAVTGDLVVTSTNSNITFSAIDEVTAGVDFIPVEQATVTFTSPGNFVQAYTITGPKTITEILDELSLNITIPGWSDIVDGPVLRFTSDDPLTIEGTFTAISDFDGISFSDFTESRTGMTPQQSQSETFTFVSPAGTFTETLTGPLTTPEIASVLASLSTLTGYDATSNGDNLVFTATGIAARTGITAAVTDGTNVSVTASTTTDGTDVPFTIDGSYTFPSGIGDFYTPVVVDSDDMFRGEHLVSWDDTEPAPSTDPDDYDFVRWIGADGLDGNNTETITLFFVNTDANVVPDAPIGEFLYNFTDGSLLGGDRNGWTLEIPILDTGTFLWQIRRSVSSSNETILVDGDSFSAPAVIGSNGLAGTSGTNTAPVYGYKRNVQTDDTGPSLTRTWEFSSASFNSVSLGNGWFSIPPTGEDSLSFVVAIASNVNNVDDVSPDDWTDPQLLGSSGVDGINSAVIYAYKRSGADTSLETDDIPSTGRTWTFATGAFDNGDLGNDWSSTIPFGAGNLFISVVVASGAGATDFVAASEWAAPQLLSQDGSAGASGITSTVVFLYQASTDPDVPPAQPTTQGVYTFSNGSLAPGSLNGWTNVVPDVPTGSFLWVIQQVASAPAETTTVTLTGSNFSNAVRVGTSGVDGTNGNSVAIVELYRTAAAGSSGLARPTGDFIYTYATNTLASDSDSLSPGAFAGWTQSIPTLNAGNSIFVIQAAAVSRTDTDTIAASEFSTEVVASTFGGDGDNGPRGAGRWNYRVGTAIEATYTQAELDAFIIAAGIPTVDGVQAAIQGDQLWIFGSPSDTDLTVTAGQQRAYIYDGTDFIEQAEVIDGSLLVSDTVTAYNVAAGSLTSTGIPVSGTAGAFFEGSSGDFVAGNVTNFIRFTGGTLTVAGEIQNLSRAALAAETGGPFFRVRPTLVATDVAAAIRTEFPTGSLAGEYVFVMVGSGGSGGAGTNSDNTATASGGGGSAAGCCIFSFYWDGTTALSVTNGQAPGITDPETNVSGTRLAGANGSASTFTYGTTLIAQANGGQGAPATGGNIPNTPGGTAVFPTQTAVEFLQTYARTGQSTSAVNRGQGGGAVDFFGIIDGVAGGSGHSPYNQGNVLVTPGAGGDFANAVGFIEDDNVRALMGIYGGSSALVSGFGGQQTGPIGGIYLENSLSTGSEAGADGGILSGGGGIRNVATTRDNLSNVINSTSSQAGNGGPGGGGGGCYCLFGRAVGGSGGDGTLWWSRL